MIICLSAMWRGPAYPGFRKIPEDDPLFELENGPHLLPDQGRCHLCKIELDSGGQAEQEAARVAVRIAAISNHPLSEGERRKIVQFAALWLAEQRLMPS